MAGYMGFCRHSGEEKSAIAGMMDFHGSEKIDHTDPMVSRRLECQDRVHVRTGASRRL
jgi:hypothetical protein